MGFEHVGNLQNLCRLCLKSFIHYPQSKKNSHDNYVKSPGLVQYSHSLLIPRLSKLLLDLTTLDISKEIDQFPKSLCSSCRKKLLEYDGLRKEALKSTKRLHEMFSNIAEKSDLIAATQIKEDVEASIVFIKEESINPAPVFENKSQDDDDDQLLVPELANMPINIKVEPDCEIMETQDLTPWFTIDFPMSDHRVKTTAAASNKSLALTFKCSICSHEYLTKGELEEHVHRHAVPCSQCSKIFSSRSTLNRHINVVHRGEKRFGCSFCKQRFGTFVSVIHHERQHTGERPYKCEICNKAFIQLKSLRVHMKRHEKQSGVLKKS